MRRFGYQESDKDFEPSDDNYENDNTDEYIEFMREQGADIEGWPKISDKIKSVLSLIQNKYKFSG